MKKKKFATIALAALVSLSAAACGGGEVGDGVVDDNGDFYTIKMYMIVNSANIPADLRKVQNELNNVLREKINAELDITAYNVSEYNGKMNNIVANYEPFDLIWTDYESYARYLEMETLFPLDYLLENYGKDIYEYYPETFWEQVRHTDGKIYATINNQILPRSMGIEMRDDVFFEEYMASASLTEEIIVGKSLSEKLDVMENYMAWLRVNKPIDASEVANRSAGGLTYGFELGYTLESLGFDTLGSSMTVPGVVRADATGKPTVINQFETDEFVELIERAKEWYQEGYIPADITQGNYNNTNIDVLPGRTWKPDGRIKATIGGVDRYRKTYQFGEAYYLQSYIMGTMWGIGVNSENPARVMKFLNLMFTDPSVHNLLKLGIEGEHYNVVDGQAVQTEKASRYNLDNVRWTFGNECIGIPLSTQPKDVFEQVTKVNKDTEVSSVIGFRFDRSSVTTEIQACTNVAYMWLSNLGNGYILNSNPNAYTEFLSELKACGADKIIEEKQKQLDEWWAKKNV